VTPLSTNHVYNFDIPEFTLWRGLVFNATFNNISVILWRTVFFLVEETRKKILSCCKSLTNIMTLWNDFAYNLNS
jgi:hypothetical protein